MTYVSSKDSTSMVASIDLSKDTTTSKPSDDVPVSTRDKRPRHSRIKRGFASIPQRRGASSGVNKAADPTSLHTTTCLRSYQTSSALFNYRHLNVYVVGNVGHPKAQIVRVVHISDTRGVGDYYANDLPNGHILIHSGDFLDGPPAKKPTPLRRNCFRRTRSEQKPSSSPQSNSPTATPLSDEKCTWKKKLAEINEFFRRQPHSYKIFVSGCWDYLGPKRPSAAEIQAHLPSAIYLEDASCEILGLKMYGIPWTSADDLRPEDGKSHFTSSFSGAAKVKAMLSRWLVRSRGRHNRHHHDSKHQRYLSSCTTDLVRAKPGTWSALDSHEGMRTLRDSKTGVCTVSGSSCCSSASSSSSSSTTSSCSSGSSPSALEPSVPASSMRDGFILPDIKAVEERYARVPPNTNIIVSHMPAWRPELYFHVVDRIQPYLHLCGHEFTSYGVTWRRGVVFSNAAVQLTSTFPRVFPQQRFPHRRKAYSSTFGGSDMIEIGENACTGELFVGASAPSKFTATGEPLGLSRDISTLPPNTPRFADDGTRPRRWRRRLSSMLGRFSFLNGSHSFNATTERLNYGTRASARILPTPSSLAAQRSGDGGFVVDPNLGVLAAENSGSYGGGGGSRSSYACRRNPLVFDVYVVIEEGVNDRIVLPDYSKHRRERLGAPGSEETAVPQWKPTQPARRSPACCVQ